MGEGGSAIDLYRLNMCFVAETEEVVFIKNKDRSDHKSFRELSSRQPSAATLLTEKGYLLHFPLERGVGVGVPRSELARFGGSRRRRPLQS